VDAAASSNHPEFGPGSIPSEFAVQSAQGDTAARFSEVVHVVVAASVDEARDLLVRSLPLAPLVDPDHNAPPLTDQGRVRLWRRDGFCCRYCGKKTVPQCVLRAVSVIFPSDFPYHPNWKTGYTHPEDVPNGVEVR
jgi:hypothetical protein